MISPHERDVEQIREDGGGRGPATGPLPRNSMDHTIQGVTSSRFSAPDAWAKKSKCGNTVGATRAIRSSPIEATNRQVPPTAFAALSKRGSTDRIPSTCRRAGGRPQARRHSRSILRAASIPSRSALGSGSA